MCELCFCSSKATTFVRSSFKNVPTKNRSTYERRKLAKAYQFIEDGPQIAKQTIL